jgi:hypothetical protein
MGEERMGEERMGEERMGEERRGWERRGWERRGEVMWNRNKDGRAYFESLIKSFLNSLSMMS